MTFIIIINSHNKDFPDGEEGELIKYFYQPRAPNFLNPGHCVSCFFIKPDTDTSVFNGRRADEITRQSRDVDVIIIRSQSDAKRVREKSSAVYTRQTNCRNKRVK